MNHWGYPDTNDGMAQVLVPIEHAETVASIVKELDAGVPAGSGEGLRLVELDGQWFDPMRIIAITSEMGTGFAAVHLDGDIVIDFDIPPAEVIALIAEKLS